MQILILRLSESRSQWGESCCCADCVSPARRERRHSSMKTAHKIRMNPTPEQVEYLKRACGTRRFIYNWGRAHWEAEYQAYKLEQETLPEAEHTFKPPGTMGLKKQFNAIRETAYPWTYDVTKCVVEGAFDDLKKAYDNFVAGRAAYPQYKK